ncbi:MAG: glycogen/starch/alpha-glucan phosphorylase, partial [Deltaproteobacteria bacterium]|nr:glycogen/starch/alpha-glucan phosphorylase [Deltaproteobacteria bacterium]
TNLDALRALEPFASDEGFQREFLRIKRVNKKRLATVIKDLTRVTVDPDSLFDVQVKRVHEYKRQLLNVLHIIHEYLCLIEDHQGPTVPRTYIFAGKAAPGYWAAKQIIKLINSVGRVINSDPRVQGQLKVVFVPDYRVSLAEKIIPAADLSEQISTAGKEASGTGNMKFALNGALTVGTLDGANIEIMEEVGQENIFIFGLRAQDIQELRSQGSYQPREYYTRHWIYHALVDQGDEYFHLADLPSYLDVQEQAGVEFQNKAGWAQKAILNVARIGKFSSDRTIREYAKDIWNLTSVP